MAPSPASPATAPAPSPNRRGRRAPLRCPAVDFADMMDLAGHGPDTYLGRGPRYPWGGLYGGQIVAQALRAAAATVDPGWRVHSLHAYFLRPGDHEAPVRYEVDRLRSGRSFVARAVTARQESVILHLSASFQLERHGSVGGAATGDAGAPGAPPAGTPPADALPDDSWTPMLARRALPAEPGRAAAWLRVEGLPDDDPVLAACAVAYLSDDLPCEAVASAHGGGAPADDVEWYGTSLDHAIWYQQPAGAGWQHHDVRTDGLRPPRGLAVGRVLDASGAHLATVTQEVLVRSRPRAT